MIDYFLKFASRAEALADAIAGLETKGTTVKQWALDHVVECQIWRNSQDTQEIVTGPGGEQITVTVHHPLAGFYVLLLVGLALSRGQFIRAPSHG